MKKMLMMLALVCAMLLGACALADGPVLLVELPEDALLIEDVQFDDGDFIQTYQLAGGVQVQMLRYATFDMTLAELADGEWTGYTAAQPMEIEQVGGCPAEGLRLAYQNENGDAWTVYMMSVEAQQRLLFTAVFPNELGQEQIEATVSGWLNTMAVMGGENEEVG